MPGGPEVTVVTVTLEPKTLTADGNDYRIAFIEDPDGYKIELVQRGTMKVGECISRAVSFQPAPASPPLSAVSFPPLRRSSVARWHRRASRFVRRS
jgi:hypothetical protein